MMTRSLRVIAALFHHYDLEKIHLLQNDGQPQMFDPDTMNHGDECCYKCLRIQWQPFPLSIRYGTV